MGCLSVVFNIIWILTGGWLTALAFFLAGVLCYITIIGIPLGRQAFKMAHLTLAPFGKTITYGGGAPSLIANVIMQKDVNYLVMDDEIIIVDEFTGRQMIGRRFSNGLHQAIEAKEGVKIRSEDKTLATITFQNLFRQYRKLSGMTGTAKTEENEFEGTYNLDVVVIPTNKPVIRVDEDDLLYVNEKAKFRAIIEEIKKCHERRQPVLVGTVSVEKSEKLSEMLKRAGLKNHNVLNARYYEREAEIVAQAGKPGAITISTNMAGRGTDIMLGGNPEQLAKAALVPKGYPDYAIDEASTHNETEDEIVIKARQEYDRLYKQYRSETERDRQIVVAAGGLRIIGTERHESRRIDNQLRGRAGRQGDPGSSVFYLAMDDDILRRFGGETMQSLAGRLNLDEDTPISAKVRPTSIPARWLRRPSRMHRKPFSLQAASRVAKSSSFRTGAATIRCTRVGTPLGPLGPFSTSSSAISSHGALFSHTSTTYCSAAAMLGSSCTTALTAVALAVKS